MPRDAADAAFYDEATIGAWVIEELTLLRRTREVGIPNLGICDHLAAHGVEPQPLLEEAARREPDAVVRGRRLIDRSLDSVALARLIRPQPCGPERRSSMSRVQASKPRPARTQAAARPERRATLSIDPDDCDPSRRPGDDAARSLSRYARAMAAAGQDQVGADFTLEATERAVAERLEGMAINMTAMTAVSNIYRAANAVRNYVERRVLAPHELTWTAWVVLWVIWIWGEIESRHVAAEAGISKGTLTGVQRTLMSKGLVARTVHPEDARRVLLSLTDEGQRLMTEVFPEFNAEEAFVTSQLDDEAVLQLARSLRAVVKQAEKA